MPTIKYPKNPNVDTAFVEQEDGTQNRALMVAPQDISTLELPNNPNSTKGYVTIDGNKQRVVLTAQIAGEGGGGSGLPDQTGHSGEFLTTDGTDASWAVALKNNSTANSTIAISGTSTYQYAVAVGSSAQAGQQHSVALGYYSFTSKDGAIAIGSSAESKGLYSVAIGKQCGASANYAIQLGGWGRSNSVANTFKVGNNNGNFEMMSADGTIPTDRFTTTPSADGTYVPTLTISSGTPTRSWAAPSGGLPSQTGNAGKFLTTDGTDASWSDKPLVNNASSPASSYIIGGAQNLTGLYKVVIGYQAKTSQDDGIAIGHSCNSDGQYATSVGKSIINQGENGVAVGHMAQIDAYSSNTVAIGYSARCSSSGAIAIGQNTRASGAKSIQLGSTGNTTTNSDSNTFKVANANGNFEIMSADGTIPTARLTKANTTVTLAVADWSSNTQTVTVNGVTSTSVVLVAPSPSDTADYVAAGILCTSQTTNSLTFTATTTPTNAITVNVVAL